MFSLLICAPTYRDVGNRWRTEASLRRRVGTWCESSRDLFDVCVRLFGGAVECASLFCMEEGLFVSTYEDN